MNTSSNSCIAIKKPRGDSKGGMPRGHHYQIKMKFIFLKRSSLCSHLLAGFAQRAESNRSCKEDG